MAPLFLPPKEIVLSMIDYEKLENELIIANMKINDGIYPGSNTKIIIK